MKRKQTPLRPARHSLDGFHIVEDHAWIVEQPKVQTVPYLPNATLDQLVRGTAISQRQIPADAHLSADAVNIYFKKELEQQIETLFTVNTPQANARELFPTRIEQDPLAETIKYGILQTRGMAKEHDIRSTTLPLVNADATEAHGVVTGIAIGAHFSWIDLQRASRTGNRLPDASSRQARVAMLEKERDIAFSGSDSGRITGFLSNAGIPTAAAATGTWSGATAQQILDDLYQVVDDIETNTNDQVEANEVWVSRSQFKLLSRTLYAPAGDNISVLQHFLATSAVTNVRAAREIPNNRLIALRNADDVLALRIVMDLQQFPEHVDIMQGVTIPWVMRTGGVLVTRPKEISFRTGI